MSGDIADALGWVLDVDGCLVRTSKAGGDGGSAIDGAREFIRSLKTAGRRVIVCTNASQRAPARYLAHLRELGFDIEDDEFVTSGSAAAEYIALHHEAASVLVVGDDGIAVPLRAAGVDVVDAAQGATAGVVVVGAGERYETATLNAACLAIDRGAAFYVTARVRWFYGGLGRAISSSSAMAAAITWITGVTAVVLGKPSIALAETLNRRLGIPGSRSVVVGDATVELDLAHLMGARSVLVLSGATTESDLPNLNEKQRPDLILEDIGVLNRLFLRNSSA